MITILDVYKSINDTLRKVFKTKIHIDDINRLSTPAFYITFVSTENRLMGRRQVEKDILIDIAYYAKSESIVESLGIKEKLDSIFLPFFRIKDRYLTAEYVEAKYVDEDLHFMINFRFYDNVEHIHAEDDDTVVTDKENEDKEIEHPDGAVETVPMEKMLELHLELESD